MAITALYNVCVICKTQFAKNWSGRRKSYCSKKCRDKVKKSRYIRKTYQERVCDVCNNKYLPKTENQKRCSEICRTKKQKETIQQSTFYKWRFEILERDGFRCRYCGASPRTSMGVKLHIDHIVPIAKGGTNEYSNLITACEYCNLGKGQAFYPNIFKLDFPTKTPIKMQNDITFNSRKQRLLDKH